MPNLIVLDSFALITYLEAEPGHEMISQLLGQAADGDVVLGMNVINLGEVWYHFARRHSEAIADQVVTEINDLGVEVVEADWALTHQAAVYKARGGISFADCFAAALAQAWKAPLVTGDLEFKRLEKEIKIQWLSRK
jgi:predicted nucleic acid-binding protein